MSDIPSSSELDVPEVAAYEVAEDIPSSHDLEPAVELEEPPYADIPSSHDTCGQFPHDEVRETFEPDPPPDPEP